MIVLKLCYDKNLRRCAALSGMDIQVIVKLGYPQYWNKTQVYGFDTFLKLDILFYIVHKGVGDNYIVL